MAAADGGALIEKGVCPNDSGIFPAEGNRGMPCWPPGPKAGVPLLVGPGTLEGGPVVIGEDPKGVRLGRETGGTTCTVEVPGGTLEPLGAWG